VRNVDKLRARLADGLVAATPVPFGADARLHGRAHEAYLTYMAGQPVAGVAVWAHTGRGLALDSHTAERVLADWRAALPDRAALVGMGAVCCALQADLIRSHATGDAARFLGLSAMVDELAEVLFVPPMEGYIRRVLWALAHLGVIPAEATHDPWGPELTAAEF